MAATRHAFETRRMPDVAGILGGAWIPCRVPPAVSSAQPCCSIGAYRRCVQSSSYRVDLRSASFERSFASGVAPSRPRWKFRICLPGGIAPDIAGIVRLAAWNRACLPPPAGAWCSGTSPRVFFRGALPATRTVGCHYRREECLLRT
jgi:hypothetical protein